MEEEWSDPVGQPDRLIDWTGERCVPWADDYQVIYEHYHRYWFAKRFTRGRTVVDLACGEGYGSYLLAQTATSVLGIDIDEASVQHAENTYVHPALEFRSGSMLDLESFRHRRFERAVCFEALEHVTEQVTLLAVIKEILEPGGILILSTPDTDVYSGELHNENPFHEHELTRREFDTLLSSMFDHVAVLGQTPVVGSSMRQATTGAARTKLRELVRQGEGWTVQRSPTRPHYLIGVASDRPLPKIRGSLLIDPEMHVVREPTRRLAQLEVVHGRLEWANAELRAALAETEHRAQELGRQVGELETLLASATSEADGLRECLTKAEERLRSTREELRGRSEELALYENAASIRLVRKVAGAVDRVLPPDTLARRLMAKSLRFGLGMTHGPEDPGRG